MIKLLFQFLLLTCLASCGKNEQTGGTIGALAGAAIGTSVAPKKDNDAGALVGALVGNLLGRDLGRKADELEAEYEQNNERRACAARCSKSWCMSCRRKVRLHRAVICPQCGDDLVRIKFCRQCDELFAVETDYRYCPYCPNRVILSLN